MMKMSLVEVEVVVELEWEVGGIVGGGGGGILEYFEIEDVCCVLGVRLKELLSLRANIYNNKDYT